MRDGYELTGGYVVTDGVVRVEVIVWRAEEEAARFEVDGATEDVAALAHRIVEEARRRID